MKCHHKKYSNKLRMKPLEQLKYVFGAYWSVLARTYTYCHLLTRTDKYWHVLTSTLKWNMIRSVQTYWIFMVVNSALVVFICCDSWVEKLLSIRSFSQCSKCIVFFLLHLFIQGLSCLSWRRMVEGCKLAEGKLIDHQRKNLCSWYGKR